MKDKIKMDALKSKHDLKDAILGLICNNNRANCKEKEKLCMNSFWTKKIEPNLIELENACQQNNWFFGYITVADFGFYELINHV